MCHEINLNPYKNYPYICVPSYFLISYIVTSYRYINTCPYMSLYSHALYRQRHLLFTTSRVIGSSIMII